MPHPTSGAVVGKPYTLQFTITPGYLATNSGFTVQSGTNLPPGLTFTAATGMLAGTPTATGLYRIVLRVDTVPASNIYCGINYPFLVFAPLSLASGGVLPRGNVGAGYMAWVAQNGASPYTFKVTSGSLPPGLSFDTTASTLTGTPLAQGAYSFTATTSDSAGESVTGQYSVVIDPPGDVYVTSAAVNFEALAGGAVQTYPVIVFATDLKNVQFAVSFPAALGGVAPAWLKLTPTSGTTPARLSVQADPGKLAKGTYLSQIQITPQGQNTFTVPVTFNVLDSRQAFGAAPAGIKVSYPANADLTKVVTTPVQVWNSGGAAVTVTATATPPVAGSAWFSITPTQYSLAAGQTQTFSVTVVGANTYTGTHFGTIELKSSNQVVDIRVQLSIAGTVVAPTIRLTPQAVQYCSYCDPDRPKGTMDSGIQIGVWNPGPDTAYTVSMQGFGSSVLPQPAQGNNSTTVSLTILPCQLGLGRHTGYLEVSAPRLTPAKIYQKVDWTIADWNKPMDASTDQWCSSSTIYPPNIDYSSGLVMVSQAGQTDKVTAQITVTGSDDEPLQFSASLGSDAPAGVSVAPARGVATSTPTTVTVTMDPSKATAGVTQRDDLVAISLGSERLWVPRAFASVFVVTPNVTAVGSAAARENARSLAAAACTPTQIVIAPTNTPSYFRQVVDWPMSIQARLVDNCGQAVTDASVTASFSNGDPGLALALTDSVKGIYGATWRPASPASSLTLTLRALKTGLPLATRPVYGAVIDDPGAPIVAANGVVNNLNSVLGAPVAPGTVAAVYGSNLASSILQATTVPLPTKLGDTQVLIGGIAAPLFFVSPGQVNLQIPAELPAHSSQDVMVLVNGNVSIPQTIQLGAVNPGIAAYSTGRVIAQHSDYTLVTPNSPAHREEWIVLYLVGMGATSPAVGSNQTAPGSPLAYATVQPKVTIDGVAVSPYFAGLTPGGIGLYQINCQVPKGARTGDLPLVVIQGDMAANAVTLPVAQ